MMKKLLCTLLFSIMTIGFVHAQADINIQGNSIDIVDGDATPDLADHTDFGDVETGSSLTRIFTIENTGDALLTITGAGFDFPPASQYAFDFTGTDFTIAAGASTTFGVIFTPSAAGVIDSGITIDSDDPDAEDEYTFAITANGVLPALDVDINIQGNSVDIADGDLSPDLADHTDFGDVEIGNSLTRTYTIQNTGGGTLTITGADFDFPPPSQYAFDFTGTDFTIDAGMSTTFDVIFTPSAAGAINTGITIESNDPDTESDYTYAITGNGIVPVPQPDINVQGNGVDIADADTTPDLADHTDFGDVAIGSSLTRTFTIQNTGDDLLTISGTSLDFPPASQYVLDFTNTDFTIAGGASTTFDVIFTPTAQGVINSGITIDSDDPDVAESEYTFAITANGIIEQDINVQGNGVDIADGDTTPDLADHTDFGDVEVGSNLTRVYTIQNTGGSILNITGIDLDFPPASQFVFDFTGTDFSIAAGGFTTFAVTFTPTASGVINSGITIESNDPDTESDYTFSITANGFVNNEPEMDVLDNASSPLAVGGTVDYGQEDVTTGISQFTFTIENNGTADLTLDDVSPFVVIGGTNPSDFTLTTVPSSTITPAGSTTFAITFNPSALGSRSATVSIANNDSDEDPYTFNLLGEGIDANTGSPLLITQYYEGLGANDNWIEVKNVSSDPIPNGAYFLVVFKDLEGTINGGIETNDPDDVTEAVQIPALAAGAVALFSRSGAALPTPGNLGPVTPTTTEVCSFDGDDVLVITTTNDSNAYNSRIDIIGTVGTNAAVDWGTDTSFIKGCGTVESPSTTYDPNEYITLSLDDVNTAGGITNIALGVQTVGPTIFTSSWDNGIPDKTKQAIINGTYANSNGSFEACDLTVNGGGTINLTGASTNYILVDGDLSINGGFNIGNTASLIMTDPDALVSGSIVKTEVTTTLNNFRDYTYWSSPVSTTIGATFPGVDPNGIFRWEVLPSNAWFVAQQSESMTAGRGYIAQAPTGVTTHTVTFSGTPNNGLVSRPVSFINDGFASTDFNLLGNPYPSAIDIDQFILLSDNDEIRDNTNMDGTIYLWTHSSAALDNGSDDDYVSSDYATYNLSGGTASSNGGPIPTNNIGSGQGFFIRAKESGTVFFENDMRLDVNGDPMSNSQFFKSNKVAAEKDRLWLDMTSEEGAFNQILIGFFDTATDGVDRGYDGEKVGAGNLRFYSKIEDTKYSIQGLGAYNQSKEIALGFDADITRTFKITISKIEGVLKDEEVYLIDNELNIVHDLKLEDYEFEVTEVGKFTDRFTLKFNSSVLGVDDLALNNSFIVYNQDAMLKIKSGIEISELKVYDMTGRLLLESKPNSTAFDVPSENIKVGTVLIVNAKMKDGSVVSKKALKY